jgi:L-ascorbate metabolism protein UlaG (beta-lactamase superfamily)
VLAPLVIAYERSYGNVYGGMTVRVRWLGWAGVEIENGDGATVVIDPLAEAAATFAGLGDAADRVALPSVVPARGERRAVAGCLTHLHRDHADAAALGRALAPGAAVHEPPRAGGEGLQNLGVAQAEAELDAVGFERRRTEPWASVEAGAFGLTALPAVDGLGDPQLSWVVEAGGRRVVHLGDTMFHGYWWRMAQLHGPFDLALVPINGAVVRFPHRRPASPLAAALDPDQAALAGELLGARAVVPIHYDGYAVDPWYRPVPDALQRFTRAAADRPYAVHVLEVGESLDLADES